MPALGGCIVARERAPLAHVVLAVAWVVLAWAPLARAHAQDAVQGAGRGANIAIAAPSGETDLTLYRLFRPGASSVRAEYALVCRAPCAVHWPRGRYQLAVGRGSGRPIPVEGDYAADGDARLEISHAGSERVSSAAWLAVGMGLGVGFLLEVLLLRAGASDEVVLGAAFGTFVVGGVVGLVLALLGQEAADVREEPSLRAREDARARLGSRSRGFAGREPWTSRIGADGRARRPRERGSPR